MPNKSEKMQRRIYNELYRVNENHRNSIVCLKNATIFQFSQINTKRNCKMVTKASISENAIYIHIELHFKVYFRSRKKEKNCFTI